MTETEWLLLDRPWQLLDFIGDRATDRKTCLLACACCHRVWNLLSHARSRVAVEVVEQFADGLVADEEREAAYEQACEANSYEYYADEEVQQTPEQLAAHLLRDAASYAASEFSFYHAARQEVLKYSGSWSPGTITDALAVLRANSRDESLAQADYDTIYVSGIIGLDALSTDERLAQVMLLRDIFGNPFRPAAFSSDWRADTAVALAAQMYASRDFSRMSILADALQDAGCDNEDILNHCRAQGVHVKGCWVVDLVLGRV